MWQNVQCYPVFIEIIFRLFCLYVNYHFSFFGEPWLIQVERMKTWYVINKCSIISNAMLDSVTRKEW